LSSTQLIRIPLYFLPRGQQHPTSALLYLTWHTSHYSLKAHHIGSDSWGSSEWIRVEGVEVTDIPKVTEMAEMARVSKLSKMSEEYT
jgi:hypothetical protein